MKLIVNKNVTTINDEGETIALNLETGIFFGLDSLGSIIWSKLCKEDSVETIISEISSNYNVSNSTVINDVNVFIELLINKGLLKRSKI